MPEKGRLRGHIIRDAFEQAYQGQPMLCGRCSTLGIVGKDQQIVYTETELGLFGHSYSVWAVCKDEDGCKQRQSRNKQSKNA